MRCVHLITVQPPTWCSVLVVESEELAVHGVGTLLSALGDGRDVVQLRGRLHLEVLGKKKGGSHPSTDFKVQGRFFLRPQDL